jgi:hypothetical protein
MRLRHAVMAAALFFSVSVLANASTVAIIYNSTTDVDEGETVTGLGNFSFSGSPSTLSLANLTSFNFTDSVVDSDFTLTFTYDLSDLTSFSATFSGGAIQTLSLTTDSLDPTKAIGPISPFPEEFIITSLGANGGGNYVISDMSSYGSTGTVVASVLPPTPPPPPPTPAPVPEPSSLGLLATGLLGAAGTVRRRLSGQSHTSC